MKTKVVIPYAENKDKSILRLLSSLQHENVLLFTEIGEKVKAFHKGIDLVFEIPTERLPLLLRDWNDAAYVYKPDDLKYLVSKHLTQSDFYNQIWENNKNIEIAGTIAQTYKDKHKVIISDNAPFLTNDIKQRLIEAIESILIMLPQDIRKYDIDVRKIQYNSLGVNKADLLYAARKWAVNFFKMDVDIRFLRKK